MKQVLLSGRGQVEVFEVPVPLRAPGGILVGTMFVFLISSGTEGSAVASRPGWLGILEKAQRSPDRVEQVWKMARTLGVHPTWELLRAKLADYPRWATALRVRSLRLTVPRVPSRSASRWPVWEAGVANHAVNIRGSPEPRPSRFQPALRPTKRPLPPSGASQAGDPTPGGGTGRMDRGNRPRAHRAGDRSVAAGDGLPGLRHRSARESGLSRNAGGMRGVDHGRRRWGAAGSRLHQWPGPRCRDRLRRHRE